ncbi:juvenile hormone epoxide hydrolase-like [Spodoptera frugiperda]|uniref:microsomal epoxide hydrolase n=1 Tax=Spodoptera frugiperda TaxID=7108 RepID=A0A9R0ESX5_SPOFR|nr:juvenile hormone epoxide hydrolase-like [Spodoptera frugiperda]
MAKKAKKKEGEVAKDRKENKVKKVDVKESNSVLTLATFVSLVAFAVLCAIAYNVYADVVYVPEMPTFDLNKSWGPNTTQPEDTSIRPYRIVFSDSMNLEIRWLFEMYRRREMQESFNDTAWTYGVHSDAFDKLFDYWIFRYDFAQREKFLNQFEQYRTKIQGLDIHYIHVKPKVEVNVKVLPLLLLHGWPGSIREFYEVIPLLTTERPGYNFVFEVIVPSLPGFGFSQAPVRPGLSPHQIAIIMRNLMQRLGHKQYYVQGGNIGHLIGSHMATIFPKEVVGFHTNFPVNFSKYAQWVWVLGSIWPTLVANEYVDRMYPLDKKVNFYLEEIGFLHLQGTKPDTIGIALQDSPAGLASYILDRMMIFTDPANKLDPDGGMKKYYTYDQLLDNIMLYWVSGSITTSMRIYKEIFEDSAMEKMIELIPTTVPTWGARFKNDLAYTPDFLLKWKYPNLLGTSNYNVGGHLAAFERPKEFSESVFQAAKAFLAFSK